MKRFQVFAEISGIFWMLYVKTNVAIAGARRRRALMVAKVRRGQASVFIALLGSFEKRLNARYRCTT